jgi:ribosomal protein S18 acetylase RimI-like enzyme
MAISEQGVAIALRPATADDRELLYRVYAETRREELAPIPWTEEQKAAFLRMQFEAQDAYYRENYVGAEFLVILRDGVPAGRLYLHRRTDEIRIVDIALLPEHRAAGIGSILLRDLQAEAGAAGKAVRIHVERLNPALRLYERLGFRQIEDKGVYYFLEWRAPEAAPGAHHLIR